MFRVRRDLFKVPQGEGPPKVMLLVGHHTNSLKIFTNENPAYVAYLLVVHSGPMFRKVILSPSVTV